MHLKDTDQFYKQEREKKNIYIYNIYDIHTYVNNKIILYIVIV